MKKKIDYCSTFYPFLNRKVLLLYHKKTHKWVPPGGRIKRNETPQQAAIRECYEETGLNAILFENLEPLHARQVHCVGVEDNLCVDKSRHLDFIFVGTVDSENFSNRESFAEMRWFTLSEVMTLNTFESVKYWVRKYINLNPQKDLAITPHIIELEHTAKNLRKEIIKIAASEYGCHLGGSFSGIDLMNACFKLFDLRNTDKFVLSKGHCAAGLYACLYYYGYISEKPSKEYGKNDSILLGHPSQKIPGVSFATGSLGHGLPLALGWALGQRMKGSAGHAFVLLGDGELQEGLIWETLQILQAKLVSNITIFVDCNGFQNDGMVAHISPLHHLAERFLAFGLDCVTIDGHHYQDIITALTNSRDSTRATVIIAKTTKGKGIKTLEQNGNSCHYMKIDNTTAAAFIKELGN